ncbi:hypothetical protein ACWC24_02820 [Streptomyces sp. NPDC001443]
MRVLTVSLALAALLYQYVEHPAERWLRDRWGRSSAPRVKPAERVPTASSR